MTARENEVMNIAAITSAVTRPGIPCHAVSPFNLGGASENLLAGLAAAPAATETKRPCHGQKYQPQMPEASGQCGEAPASHGCIPSKSSLYDNSRTAKLYIKAICAPMDDAWNENGQK